MGPFQWNAVGHQLLDFIIECGPELMVMGPFQWNAVGHQLLDFIIECGPELMDRCISGINGHQMINVICSHTNTISVFFHM